MKKQFPNYGMILAGSSNVIKMQEVHKVYGSNSHIIAGTNCKIYANNVTVINCHNIEVKSEGVVMIGCKDMKSDEIDECSVYINNIKIKDGAMASFILRDWLKDLYINEQDTQSL